MHFPLPRAKPLIDGGCNFIRPLALRDIVVVSAELSGTESGRSAWLVFAGALGLLALHVPGSQSSFLHPWTRCGRAGLCHLDAGPGESSLPPGELGAESGGGSPTTLSSWNVLESGIRMLNSPASELEGTLGVIQSSVLLPR